MLVIFYRRTYNTVMFFAPFPYFNAEKRFCKYGNAFFIV